MVVRRVVEAQGKEYVISPDDPAPLASRIWGILLARLINEVTTEPVTSPVQLTSNVPECSPRISRDGLVGLIGIPSRVFPALVSRSFVLMMDIQAEGYLPRTVSVTIHSDQRRISAAGPRRGDRVLTLNEVARLLVGETLMVGTGATFEEVRIGMLGPGNQVTTTTPFVHDHDDHDPVVPVVPDNFAPFNAGDIRLVPAS